MPSSRSISAARCRSICSSSSLSTRNRGRSAVSHPQRSQAAAPDQSRSLPPDRRGHLLEPIVRGMLGEPIGSAANLFSRIVQKPRRLVQRLPDFITLGPGGIYGVPKCISLTIGCGRDDGRKRFRTASMSAIRRSIIASPSDSFPLRI